MWKRHKNGSNVNNRTRLTRKEKREQRKLVVQEEKQKRRWLKSNMHTLPPATQGAVRRQVRSERLTNVGLAVLAVFISPLAVALKTGPHGKFFLNILLFLLLIIPGIIHAWIVIFTYPGFVWRRRLLFDIPRPVQQPLPVQQVEPVQQMVEESVPLSHPHHHESHHTPGVVEPAAGDLRSTGQVPSELHPEPPLATADKIAAAEQPAFEHTHNHHDWGYGTTTGLEFPSMPAMTTTSRTSTSGQVFVRRFIEETPGGKLLPLDATNTQFAPNNVHAS
jgi:uncharacterized membrane protein YqaE (UPF0057 family)